MSESETTTPPQTKLESGTYEIIRSRLNHQANDLRERLTKLNDARKDVFGSIDMKLTRTERITTAHNCVPRDMVAVGSQLLFGYNVQFGLKTEIELADVFAVYDHNDGSFHEHTLELIGNEQFERDFKEVYRYYKNAVFAKFFSSGPYLYFVFRVGQSVGDIKTFKWAVDGETLRYLDNRSDHEVRFPPQHEFEWNRTTRDMHRFGEHPHISIEDKIFVETVGGDLTLKIEDNTTTGEGIYAEPVEDPDQTLDDAELFYSVIGNIILLKVRPYGEKNFRHIVYNQKIQQAKRIDSIANACVLLPDDQGLVFANGYYLQDGEHKTFDSEVDSMLFERRLIAANGEDYLFVFYHRTHGSYILLPYNLIEQQVDTPILCHGYTLFASGEMMCFKSTGEPQKHHAIQNWQTPFVGEDHEQHANTDSYLYKVGNRDIVRGMAECHEVIKLIRKEDTYGDLYVDLVKEATDVLDSYFWVNADECFKLQEPLSEIRAAGASAIEEFDKVTRVKQATSKQTQHVGHETREILGAITHRRFDHINDFVTSLSDLRRVRGEIISLRDLRYIDHSLVESLEEEVAKTADKLSHRCVEFLLKPSALDPYKSQIDLEAAKVDKLTKVTDAKQLDQDIATAAEELEMLIEIVSNLKIDDATHRTAIIDNISVIFSSVNQARAALKAKTRDLMSVEGVAEFNSQMKLLNQSVVNYLDICDTPEKCEEFLTKVMIQIEELEGRFAEFDEFVTQLTDKREEIYNAFETRKLSLLEARNKRASTLMSAAERILKGIKTRVDSLESVNDINGYFASDLMIEKVRDIVEQLTQLEDSVKVDDIQSRLKTIREDAVRQLQDRQDLFVGGDNIIQFGNHQFSVNVQQLDLTTVLRDDVMHLHLTGTNFFEPIDDTELNQLQDIWQQEVVSENVAVYRGEYLAFQMLRAVGTGDPHEDSTQTLPANFLRLSEEDQLAAAQRFMGPRYNEAYSKGVHDHDALKIFRSLLHMQSTIGLLRYHARARAMARVYWNSFADPTTQELLAARMTGVGEIRQLFQHDSPLSTATLPQTSTAASELPFAEYKHELKTLLLEFTEQTRLFPTALADQAADYLFQQLTMSPHFAISRVAAELHDSFHTHVKANGFEKKFTASLKTIAHDPASCFQLARDWTTAFLAADTHQPSALDEADYTDEVAALLVEGNIDHAHIIDGHVTESISGFVGSHSVIDGGTYTLNYNHFTQRLPSYAATTVPRFLRYVDLKKEIVEDARATIRLDEFRPRVLSSFVRNRLIDEVYLPLVGDNLAKQIGVVGEDKRTDLMGLLLLLSPPGYGKTTLMEYIANRLGVIFMKINGPAIGHQVTSLDPTEAPNASAREEIEKLNLSLEMGDNVMLYVDDIQHCNPEFLQKFISLCDAQRKLVGVYRGKTRTYDLRGRKVIVVMAGNPYTESGEKFQIPDMLSNRADVYNLGEIIGDSAEVFELSYLENCLTSNPILNKLASRSHKDVHAVIQMAERDEREGVALDGSYSLEELNEMVTVVKKLLRVRDIVLQVNREYIRSAAQSDDYRTEPPFKLQGSYRNMNRIAEKVVPIMNDAELQTLIMSNYENDAQTLTSDNEANMLKFKELMGVLTADEESRWSNIKRTFSQNVKMRGIEADGEIAQVLVQLSSFNDGLANIQTALTRGIDRLAEVENPDTELHARVEELKRGVEGIATSIQEASRELAEQVKQPPAVTPATTGMPTAPESAVADTVDRSPTAAGKVQRHIVQHRMSPLVLDVLQSQFALMQDFMVPVLNAINLQSNDITQLEKSLTDSLSLYDKMLKALEVAREAKQTGRKKKKATRKKKA